MIRLAVRRPVATLALTAASVGIGVSSLLRLPLERLPDVTLPRLEVTASWPGASPEVVEALVTAPIEATARRVRGVESIASTSHPGHARLEITLSRATDVELARIELVERLAALARTFPPGADPPAVAEHVPRGFAAETEALLVSTLAGPSSPGALRRLARERVRPLLMELDGVDEVHVAGGTPREVRVRLDPERLAARGLASADVRRAIETGLHVAETTGRLWDGGREVTAAIDDRATTVADVARLVVRPARTDAPAIRLGDLGTVALGWAEPRSLHRVNGVAAVSLYVHRAARSNAIRVVDRVRERLEILATTLPPGHTLVEERDGTARIRAELAELRRRALVSAGVVLLVLLVALGRVRPALLAFGTIAATVLIALNVLWLAGLSLNLLTLAGLAMGLGLVVDNAIVVLESIEARRDHGVDAREAAVEGARRVALPLLAATATTLVAFGPFVWLQGDLAAYYVPFAVTVAAVLAVSLGVALTAVPAAAARIEPDARASRGERPPPGFARRVYRRAIERTLAHPGATAWAAASLLAAAAWLFWHHVPRESEWGAWDEPTRLVVRITLPPGAELAWTDAVARAVEAELAGAPGVERFSTHVRRRSAAIVVAFPDSLEATRAPAVTRERLVAFGRRFGGAEVRVYGHGGTFTRGGMGPPRYRLTVSGYDYRRLSRYAHALAERLRSLARIRKVDPDASGAWYERDEETELVLVPDRTDLAGYGITVEELLDRASEATLSQVGRDLVFLSGEEIDLDVKLAGAGEADVHALLMTNATTTMDRPVRIGDVAEIRARRTLGKIVRENQRYQRVVAYEFRGPRKLGDRVRDRVLSSTALAPGYSIEAAEEERRDEEPRQIALVVVLALTFVFLVTAALFESFRAPVVVLVAVPLAGIGIVLVWLVADRAFGREAWIGVVMTSGIVVNNAILVVDRIGALRRGADGRSRPLREAALEGTLDRLRPILMTTATTVLGLLPLILFSDEGAATLWSALALATSGGLVVSAALVPVAIPPLYVLVMARRTPARFGLRKVA